MDARITTDTSHHSLRVTAVDIAEIRSDLGHRIIVRATLEDGSNRRLVDVPKGRVHLMPEGLVGRTFEGAHNQILCWLEGQDDGVHRIVEILKVGEIDNWRLEGVNGDWELVARMSDGTSGRVLAFYQDELRLTDEDAQRFLNLSVEQAIQLKIELNTERVWGFNVPDYSKLNICFVCRRKHR